ISDEVIVQRDPEWLVRNSEQPTVPETDVYNATYAVRHDQVVVLNRSYISQPAPRVVQPIETLAHAIHADAFANETANETTTSLADANATDSERGTSAASETSATGTSSGSSPGLGVAGAIGALLAALALARRWE
ncbi:MAG: ABC transporter substrate-binding protein, partial [Halarchaeum sp.]